jgi:hypothetical protein
MAMILKTDFIFAALSVGTILAIISTLLIGAFFAPIVLLFGGLASLIALLIILPPDDSIFEQ